MRKPTYTKNDSSRDKKAPRSIEMSCHEEYITEHSCSQGPFAAYKNNIYHLIYVGVLVYIWVPRELGVGEDNSMTKGPVCKEGGRYTLVMV